MAGALPGVKQLKHHRYRVEYRAALTTQRRQAGQAHCLDPTVVDRTGTDEALIEERFGVFDVEQFGCDGAAEQRPRNRRRVVRFASLGERSVRQLDGRTASPGEAVSQRSHHVYVCLPVWVRRLVRQRDHFGHDVAHVGRVTAVLCRVQQREAHGKRSRNALLLFEAKRLSSEVRRFRRALSNPPAERDNPEGH